MQIRHDDCDGADNLISEPGRSENLRKGFMDREIFCVLFVRDYLQLDFEPSGYGRISIYADFDLEATEGVVAAPGPGSRELLCELIGERVIDIQDAGPDLIIIKTSNLFEIRVDVTKMDPPMSYRYRDLGGSVHEGYW